MDSSQLLHDGTVQTSHELSLLSERGEHENQLVGWFAPVTKKGITKNTTETLK